jgi:hypothetical protein
MEADESGPFRDVLGGRTSTIRLFDSVSDVMLPFSPPPQNRSLDTSPVHLSAELYIPPITIISFFGYVCNNKPIQRHTA